MTEKEVLNRRNAAAKWYREAGIILTTDEVEHIEIADFGLGKIDEVGLQAVTYINTDRYCGKEMLLLPGQICPEHKHPTRPDGSEGKQETFRCRWGEVYVYVPGEKTEHPKAYPPAGDEKYYTCQHEIILKPGEQFTMLPDTPHWFTSGITGCIVSEFSSNSDDDTDVFTDTRITRKPKY